MRVPRYVLASFVGVVLAAASPHTQAQDQTEPRPFQTEVNYVRVDLYPTVNDRPVTDLLASEIDVFEDDVPQKIDRLEHVSIGSRPQSTQPDPSSVRDMRRAAQDPRARVFVLFIDPRHVDLEGSMQVRRPLVDALNELIGGDDLIAVMTPEVPARSLTFSRRTGSVEQMLAQYWGEKDKVIVRDPVEARYEACYNTSVVDGPAIAQEMIARRRETLVLDAVDDLVQFLRGLREERKAVITISDGWQLYGPNLNLLKALQYRNGGQVYVPVPGAGKNPITGTPTAKDPRVPDSLTISNDGAGTLDRASCEVDRNALAELKNEQRFVGLMQAANRGNVSFYPVGPGGFSNRYVPLTAQRRSLEMMADITDGRATLQPFYIEENLRRIVDDLSSYYLLGYYSNAKPDGRYHRITVRVKRPGVAVRARAGYLAASAAEAASRVSSTVA
ncbi:MAG: VWA domain-containing protein, partial [Acidobacteria bacterium]